MISQAKRGTTYNVSFPLCFYFIFFLLLLVYLQSFVRCFFDMPTKSIRVEYSKSHVFYFSIRKADFILLKWIQTPQRKRQQRKAMPFKMPCWISFLCNVELCVWAGCVCGAQMQRIKFALFFAHLIFFFVFTLPYTLHFLQDSFRCEHGFYANGKY